MIACTQSAEPVAFSSALGNFSALGGRPAGIVSKLLEYRKLITLHHICIRLGSKQGPKLVPYNPVMYLISFKGILE